MSKIVMRREAQTHLELAQYSRYNKWREYHLELAAAWMVLYASRAN